MVEFSIADRDDLAGIIALYLDDELGSARETDDLHAYEAAFDEIAADPNSFIVVGRDGSYVVATLQLTVIANLTRRGAKRGLIEAVHVARAHQRKGIGRQLIGWTIDFGKEKGCRMFQLTTNRRRSGVVEFYESLGFVNSHNGLKLYLADPR